MGGVKIVSDDVRRPRRHGPPPAKWMVDAMDALLDGKTLLIDRSQSVVTTGVYRRLESKNMRGFYRICTRRIDDQSCYVWLEEKV